MLIKINSFILKKYISTQKMNYTFIIKIGDMLAFNIIS